MFAGRYFPKRFYPGRYFPPVPSGVVNADVGGGWVRAMHLHSPGAFACHLHSPGARTLHLHLPGAKALENS